MLRWCVNIHAWNPTSQELNQYVRYLPLSEQEHCKSFKHGVDRQRAVVSRLLQRRAIHEVTRIPYSRIEIRKTEGKKPYLWTKHDTSFAPNFNFNIAHEVEQNLAEK